MTARVQGGRTATPNAPPADGSLAPGELYVEMADPLRLWTGVPTGVAAAGKKLILDTAAAAAADAAAVKKAGDTMTGPLVLSGQPTLPAQAANMSYVDTQSVSTFNTRKGVVTLTGADITAAGGALLASPALSGNPTSTTPPPGDNDTSIATTAFVNTAIAAQPGTVIAPTVPAFKTGQLWWDSTGGQLYVGYDDGSTTQYVPASNTPLPANVATKADVDAAQNNVGRNYVHNSMFNVAQRGTGPFSTNGYTTDRWAIYLPGGGTQSVRRIALVDGNRAGIGDEAAWYTLEVSFTGSATAGSYNMLYQNMEDARRLAGRTVILSFWAQGSAALKLGASFTQRFGFGGPSPSPDASTAGQSVTLTTGFVRYALTFIIPSAAGKTFGTTAGTDNTGLNFWFSGAADQNANTGSVGVQSGVVYVWGVQLEVAQPGQTQPTPLEKPDPQQDLAKCQRFYQVGTAGLAGYNVAGQNLFAVSQLPVTMRDTPTFTLSGINVVNCSGATASAFGGPGSYSTQATVVATGQASFYLTYAASADL